MDEIEHLKTLTKNEKRYLSKFECAWCDQPLNRVGCSAVYSHCSDQTRIDRRKKCLKKYKPRNTRFK